MDRLKELGDLRDAVQMGNGEDVIGPWHKSAEGRELAGLERVRLEGALRRLTAFVRAINARLQTDDLEAYAAYQDAEALVPFTSSGGDKP